MAKKLIDLTSTGLTVGDITFDWCKKLSDDSNVTVSGVTTLTERGGGYYILDVPVTEESDFRIHETSTPSNFSTGILSNYNIQDINSAVRLTYQSLFDLIESQRGAHTAGRMFYWDPVNGNDSWDGTTRETARLTFAGAYDLVEDSRHDLVIGVPSYITGVTQVDATGDNQIIMNKRYSFLRGPGRDFLLLPSVNSHPTIALSAEGCEISGFRMQTQTTASPDAVEVTGSFAKLHNFWIDYARGNGVLLTDVSHCQIYDFVIQDTAQQGSGNAIQIDGTGGSEVIRNFIHSGKILNSGGDAIQIKGSNATANFIYSGKDGMFIHGSTGWGISEKSGADQNFIIGPLFHLSNNSLGNINLTGVNSVSENVGFIGDELSNVVEDDIVRDSNGDKLSSTLFMYDSALNANLHNRADGLMFSYNVTATYMNRFMTLFRSIKV